MLFGSCVLSFPWALPAFAPLPARSVPRSARKHGGKTPSLTLPVPAVVRALQPGALPPVLVSPHHGPAEDTRGKRRPTQPKLPRQQVQVHPYTPALVGRRWARRTECLSVLPGIPCCELGAGQTGRWINCICRCPVQQGFV